MLGTVVATSGIVALLSDVFFTYCAYLIGKRSNHSSNSVAEVVKMPWYYRYVQ